ncbi:hypothetical protein R5W24_004263 [Gemmata sp. JC717]|uniref:Uncharacterized protein n=1 Tax=Gemmata algarum TaxID=2975278 RepID=A0ABU5F0Q4_9BACT|nr:hypothetical protein [Gemmata algarum]MDY3555127.1 hypothetical protein [Gemmata algarum]MDY3560986.1 hypothetical protein [Gemmata algarum]
MWHAHGWKTGDGAGVRALWVRIEKPGDEEPLKFAFSNLPAGTRRVAAVRRWKSR